MALNQRGNGQIPPLQRTSIEAGLTLAGPTLVGPRYAGTTFAGPKLVVSNAKPQLR